MPISYPKSRDKQLEFWKRRIEHAIDYWQPVFEPAQVLINQYNNESATTREREQERLNIGDIHDPSLRSKANIVFGYIDQAIANMAAHNPTFSITANSKAGVGSERVVSKVVNYWYKETDQLRQDKRVLLDAHLAPFGGKKIGYTADLDAQLISNRTINPGRVINNPYDESLFLMSGEITTVMPDQQHAQHIEAHLEFLQQPDTDEARAALLESHIEDHTYYLEHPDAHRNTSVKWESPYGMRWAVGDILIDPMASDGLADAGWIAFRYVRHIDDMIYDDSLDTGGLEPNHRMLGAPEYEEGTFDTDDFGLVEGYEIYARGHIVGENSKKNLWLDLTRDNEKFLRYDDAWPIESLEDYPCELLYLQDGITSWHTSGPLIMGGADSMQALVNEILDSYLSVIRKQKNLFLYDPMYINDEEIEAILQADDMESFEVEGLVEAQGRAVQAIQFGDVPPEKGQILSIVQQMFDRANGTPQPISLPQADSATEANINDRRNTSREDERAEKFAKYQIRGARKFWQMTVEFKPEKLFLIDPRALEEAGITEELAQGEYAFEMDVSSAAVSIAVERKQAMDLISLLQQLDPMIKEQNNGQGADIGQLLKDLLVRGYRIVDPERILPFLNQPLSQDVVNPLASPDDGGLPNRQAQMIRANQAQPTQSNIEADAMRTDRGGTSFNTEQGTAEGQ